MKRLTMAKKMERNESMLQSDIATIFSGDANNGLQIAHNSGRVSTSINIDKFCTLRFTVGDTLITDTLPLTSSVSAKCT